jgi:hypothetical protein
VLAVGDRALGFWKALRDVFADTKEQRCWWHKIGNVLAALPKSAHKDAKAALAEIYSAEDRDHAEQAAKMFAAANGAKWPKAVAKITNELDVLLAFYDFPGEHWIHLRTTNPIERPSQPSALTISLGASGNSPDRHLPVCGGAAGSCTVTQSPPAARGVRVRVPSCAWVMLLTIARPRPTPACSVRMRSVPRRNGSTSVDTSCGVSFSPVFSTVSTTLWE